MWAPEVPPESSPTIQDMDSWHLLPQFTPGTPIDVTAGWAASPVNTRPLNTILNSWVDWSNVSKFLAQENNSNTKMAPLRIKLGTFQLPGQFDYPTSHALHLPYYTHTHTCIHTQMHVHTQMHAHTHRV